VARSHATCLGAIVYKASLHRIGLDGNERARIDSSGRLLVGTSTARTTGLGSSISLLVEGAPDTINIGTVRNSNNASSAKLVLAKTRGSAVGSNTAVSSGDSLGVLEFDGADGTQLVCGATIEVAVDGTPGANDMPGRLMFSTTADGASTPTERMRITSAGKVGIGVTGPLARLHSSVDNSIYSFGATGTTKALRIRHDTETSAIEGVDITLGASYQPLLLGGSYLAFATGGSEKARLDSSGRLLVGTSSASAMDSSSQFGSATPRQTIFENTATGGAAFVNVQGEMNGSAATRIAGINFALSTQTTITESAKSASLYVTATDAFANTPSLFIAVGNDNAISIPTSGIANFIKGLTIPTGKAIGGAGIINMSGSSGHELNNIASSLCLTTDSAADGSIIVFDRSGVGQGSISVTTGTVSYNQFLGSHWAALTDWSRPNIKLGTILETINELTDWKYVAIEVEGKQKKICYNGTAAPDDMVSVEYEGKTYEGIVELEDNSKFNKAVKVKVNDTAASKAVYGVFVGWNTDGNFDGGIWNDMYVGAVGNYVIRMAAGQEPEIGDLVEADGTGCAVVQADDIIRTKTVAKITSTIPQVAYDDGSFIVTCVLYCG
jgi:hypothetical protein